MFRVAGEAGRVGSIAIVQPKQPTVGDVVLFGYKPAAYEADLVPYPAIVVSVDEPDDAGPTLGLVVFTAKTGLYGAVSEWKDRVSYSPTLVEGKWTPRPEAHLPAP